MLSLAFLAIAAVAADFAVPTAIDGQPVVDLGYLKYAGVANATRG